LYGWWWFGMRIECLIWHVDFVSRRVSRETLGDGG